MRGAQKDLMDVEWRVIEAAWQLMDLEWHEADLKWHEVDLGRWSVDVKGIERSGRTTRGGRPMGISAARQMPARHG